MCTSIGETGAAPTDCPTAPSAPAGTDEADYSHLNWP